MKLKISTKFNSENCNEDRTPDFGELHTAYNSSIKINLLFRLNICIEKQKDILSLNVSSY
jgi:hypothetical protein